MSWMVCFFFFLFFSSRIVLGQASRPSEVAPPPTVSKKPPISQWIVGQDVGKAAGVTAACDRKAKQASSESASGVTD